MKAVSASPVQALRILLADAIGVIGLHILAQPPLHSITNERLKLSTRLIPGVRELLLLLLLLRRLPGVCRRLASPCRTLHVGPEACRRLLLLMRWQPLLAAAVLCACCCCWPA
jgi:hypothetical protein